MSLATYNVEISAQAQALLRNLKDTRAVQQTICRTMDQQNQLTLGYTLSHFLSGPGKKDLTTLAVVTGFLRRSSHAIPAKIVGSQILSGLGANVKYAAAHEFGFDGEVTVKAHQRRNSFADRYDFKGTEVNRITALRAGILSKKQASQHDKDTGKYVFSKKSAKQTAVGGLINVKAHPMHMHLAARRMFQRGIEARLAEYGPALSAAITKGWSSQN